MIYSHTLDTVSLVSSWSCLPVKENGIWVWKIVSKPTAARKTLEYPVSLPADAVISRIWINMTLGSPFTGAAYKRVNDVSIPSTGVVELEGVTPEMTTFSATFEFKANGKIFEDDATHTSTLTLGFPTLNIEYTSESYEEPIPDENHPGNITRDENAGNQLPRLLDAGLAEVTRLEPTRLSLDLQIDPLSTATMELGADQPAVKVRDLLELFDANGSAGIFRVTKTDEHCGHSRTLWLKHGFVTLSDDLTIGVQAISGTFREVISSILDAQTVQNWVLGDVELPDEYELVYPYSYTSLMEAIDDIFGMLPEGYAWEFDMLQYPWVMHLRALKDDDFCECRENRNLSAVNVTVDASNLCTRVYPYGSGEGTDRINLSTLTGSLFVDADTKDTWGIVSRTFTEEDIFDSVTLQDVALRYLEKHKDPLVSVSLDAMALYALTGEPLDRFRLGRLCRLPLPAYGVVMNERVISINYPDVYGKPTSARVMLANKVRDITDEIADLLREATASKLIGGTVETTEIKDSYSGVTTTSPMVVDFSIEEYGNMIAARLQFTCVTSTGGSGPSCSITVDGNDAGTAASGSTVDIFQQLKRDESGVPVVGAHWVRLRPNGISGTEYGIKATVILKTIERK